MTSINLLAWREERRQDQKKEFGILAALMVALAVTTVGLIHMQMASKIDYQLDRNRFLTTEISKLS